MRVGGAKGGYISSVPTPPPPKTRLATPQKPLLCAPQKTEAGRTSGTENRVSSRSK